MKNKHSYNIRHLCLPKMLSSQKERNKINETESKNLGIFRLTIKQLIIGYLNVKEYDWANLSWYHLRPKLAFYEWIKLFDLLICMIQCKFSF
ncbi:unnamed protein product [Schistosoma haematobium]|nr:unnamed protein product [Schistosoma haematobium]